ncbi:MAG: ankyrin repeat domain-containing protein [Marmoricola sp.]
MSDLDRAGRSKLHYAAADKDLELARELLAQGFDVNLRDAAGWTPLHFAAQSQSAEMVEVLLDNGAEVNAPNAVGEVPLLTALGRFIGDPSTVRLIRDRGGDPSLQNRAGVSAESLSRVVANYDLVKVLFSNDPVA